MVARLLGVTNPGWAEDASDALAVAICHLNQRRMNRLAGL
jgi:crossover junction endodeoxyribonuclease RuvC